MAWDSDRPCLEPGPGHRRSDSLKGRACPGVNEMPWLGVWHGGTPLSDGRLHTELLSSSRLCHMQGFERPLADV